MGSTLAQCENIVTAVCYDIITKKRRSGSNMQIYSNTACVTGSQGKGRGVPSKELSICIFKESGFCGESVKVLAPFCCILGC